MRYFFTLKGTVIDVIKRYEQPPTQKYKYPMTESQEIGFITTPLVGILWEWIIPLTSITMKQVHCHLWYLFILQLKQDVNDIRLHHRRRQTDVTESKEAEWKLVEQTKNMH